MTLAASWAAADAPAPVAASPGPWTAQHDRLHRLRIRFAAEDRQCHEALQPLLAPFPLARCAADEGPPDLRIALTRAPSALPRPPASALAQTLFGLHIADAGPRTWVWDDTAVFRTHPEAGVGRLTLGPAFSGRPLSDRHNLFLTGLFPLLLARGYYDLHAAGVVRQERGYLLLGESGSGKSTTALALVEAGWHYLSDDAVLLHAAAPGVEAIGFRRPFSIDPSHAERWPSLAKHLEAPGSAGESKRFLDPDSVYGPQRRRAAMRPSVLLFTTVADQRESRVSPLDPAAALARLIPQSASLAFNRRSARAQLDTLRRLVEQTRAYALQAGRDVLVEPERLAALLAGLPSGED